MLRQLALCSRSSPIRFPRLGVFAFAVLVPLSSSCSSQVPAEVRSEGIEFAELLEAYRANTWSAPDDSAIRTAAEAFDLAPPYVVFLPRDRSRADARLADYLLGPFSDNGTAAVLVVSEADSITLKKPNTTATGHMSSDVVAGLSSEPRPTLAALGAAGYPIVASLALNEDTIHAAGRLVQLDDGQLRDRQDRLLRELQSSLLDLAEHEPSFPKYPPLAVLAFIRACATCPDGNLLTALKEAARDARLRAPWVVFLPMEYGSALEELNDSTELTGIGYDPSARDLADMLTELNLLGFRFPVHWELHQ